MTPRERQITDADIAEEYRARLFDIERKGASEIVPEIAIRLGVNVERVRRVILEESSCWGAG